jgi:hypothetical protein
MEIQSAMAQIGTRKLRRLLVKQGAGRDRGLGGAYAHPQAHNRNQEH